MRADGRGCLLALAFAPLTCCLCCLQTADQQYMEGFNDELEAFKERVRGRAKVRIEKAMKEYEEEERQKRLGPGGLDPVEVYESLPSVSHVVPAPVSPWALFPPAPSPVLCYLLCLVIPSWFFLGFFEWGGAEPAIHVGKLRH